MAVSECMKSMSVSEYDSYTNTIDVVEDMIADNYKFPVVRDNSKMLSVHIGTCQIDDKLFQGKGRCHQREKIVLKKKTSLKTLNCQMMNPL